MQLLLSLLTDGWPRWGAPALITSLLLEHVPSRTAAGNRFILGSVAKGTLDALAPDGKVRGGAHQACPPRAHPPTKHTHTAPNQQVTNLVKDGDYAGSATLGTQVDLPRNRVITTIHRCATREKRRSLSRRPPKPPPGPKLQVFGVCACGPAATTPPRRTTAWPPTTWTRAPGSSSSTWPPSPRPTRPGALPSALRLPHLVVRG